MVLTKHITIILEAEVPYLVKVKLKYLFTLLSIRQPIQNTDRKKFCEYAPRDLKPMKYSDIMLRVTELNVHAPKFQPKIKLVGIKTNLVYMTSMCIRWGTLQ